MDLAYVAHSERCALLLDADGICRWVVPKVDATDAMVAAARRCIGAQYVATLDRDTPGYMGHAPRVGTNMLFALVTDGRVSLVRFGPLVAFEELDAYADASSSFDAAAPAAEREDATSEEVTPEVEDEPMPPTVADPPHVDDLIRSLASAPDLGLSDDEAVVAEDDAVVADVAESLDVDVEELAEPIDATIDATPAVPAADAADMDATPVAPDVALTPTDASDDVEIVTGSFKHASVRAIDVREDAPSDLEALDAQIAPRAPVSQASADSVDRSLDRIVELTSPAVADGSAPTADDSELGVITTAFARSEELAALLESDLEIVLDTGSFARASSRDLDDADTDSDPFMAETERVPRPSGFVKKQTPSGEQAPDEHAITSDDETRRFSRAAGDVPFVELDSTPDSPRRGMLPRHG